MKLIDFVQKITFAEFVSVLALFVSCISIFWNIYRDLLLKGKLRISTQISNFIGPMGSSKQSYITISVVNHGPGAIICESIFARKRGLFHWKAPKYYLIIPDYKNPLSAKIPKKIEVGEKILLVLPYQKEAILASSPTHLGIKDSFGRMHWSDKKSLDQATKTYLSEFPAEKWRSHKMDNSEDTHPKAPVK